MVLSQGCASCVTPSTTANPARTGFGWITEQQEHTFVGFGPSFRRNTPEIGHAMAGRVP
jgi:hypothetical protein